MIDIGKRIDILMAGPKRISFAIVYDEDNNVWLGRVSASMWSLYAEMYGIERRGEVATQGVTPAEVLRKLAEMLE